MKKLIAFMLMLSMSLSLDVFGLDLNNLDSIDENKPLPTMTFQQLKARLTKDRAQKLMKKTFEENIKRPFGYKETDIKSYCRPWEDRPYETKIEPRMYKGFFMIHPTKPSKDVYVPWYFAGRDYFRILYSRVKFIEYNRKFYNEGKISKDEFKDYESMYVINLVYVLYWMAEETLNKPMFQNMDDRMVLSHEHRSVGVPNIEIRDELGNKYPRRLGAYEKITEILYVLDNYDIVNMKALHCGDRYQKVKYVDKWTKELQKPAKLVKKFLTENTFDGAITTKEFFDFMMDYRVWYFNNYTRKRTWKLGVQYKESKDK